MTVITTRTFEDSPRRTSVISYDSEDDLEGGEDTASAMEAAEMPLDRETCHDLARSAMQYTLPSQDEKQRSYGRQLLSEATSRRRIPGLLDGKEESCTMQDCLTAYYLSEANRNLGRENSRHYYLQEALTLVESLMLKKQKKSAQQRQQPNSQHHQGEASPRREYESAKVNASQVLAEWTSGTIAQPM